MTRKLAPRRARFIAEYLVDLNATQAAIRAGYSVKTAKAIGCELLTFPDVQAALAKAQEERAGRTKASADEVLHEITRLAMFDPADLTRVKSPEDIRKLPEDVRRAIVGWSWDRQGRFTIKTAKETALEMMGRHHALFRTKVESESTVNVIHSGSIEHRSASEIGERVADLLGAGAAGDRPASLPH